MALERPSALWPHEKGVPADWRLLLGLNLYRLLLVTLLLTIQQLGVVDAFFETSRSSLFQQVCVAYALAALLVLLPAFYRRPRIRWQAMGNLLVDSAAVVMLVHATGGVPGGLGMLLVPSVMAVSLLLPTRLAMAAAAVATVAMLGEELVRHSPWYGSSADYTATGVLGLLFFATAIGANSVAQRARTSEALARKVGSEFEDLASLNHTVLETMLTGVAVVDADNRIRTLNPSAANLLQASGEVGGEPLLRYSPALNEALQRWRAGAATLEGPIAPVLEGGPELLPRFRRLNAAPDAPVLVLLEDAARVRDQAQQIKLASLGRLSASIAHEIRNPLSAIHHAAQLLEEGYQAGEADAEADAKLVGIIQKHSRRIDVIVRDVLNLSRAIAEARVFDLNAWLIKAMASYREAQPNWLPELHMEPGLSCRFDPNHLQQVLFNLLDNARLHGRRGVTKPLVRVNARRLYELGGVLEVEDDGPGVPPNVAQHLFEPFFTTTTTGTGLGLYLARELCAYNQAKLTLHARDGGGAIFRITFVAPELPDPAP